MEEKKESSNCLFPLRNNFFLERARYGNKQSTWVQSNNILILILTIIIIFFLFFFLYKHFNIIKSLYTDNGAKISKSYLQS